MRRLAERLAPATHLTLPARPRRVYILPTGAGLAFGLTVLTLGAAAVNHGNNLALALACLLAGLGVAAAVATHLALARLTLEAVGVSPVFCGEDAPCQVRLRLPGKVACRVELQAGTGPWTPQRLLPGAATLQAPLPTTRRGPIHELELGLATRHPLGLFRAWTRVRLAVDAAVYPRPWPGCPAYPTLAGAGEADGAAGPRPGDDPVELRPYHPGDSPRRVAWKAAARSLGRGGPLVVLERHDEGGGEVLLHWDACPGQGEERISRLTACVLRAEAAGLRYGLGLPGRLLPTGRGPAHRHRLLDALARLPAVP